MEDLLVSGVVLVIAAIVYGVKVIVTKHLRKQKQRHIEDSVNQIAKDSAGDFRARAAVPPRGKETTVKHGSASVGAPRRQTTYIADRWQPQTPRDDSDDGFVTGMMIGAALNSVMHSSESSASTSSESSSSSWGLSDSDSRSSISSSMDTSSSWDSSDSGPSSDW